MDHFQKVRKFINRITSEQFDPSEVDEATIEKWEPELDRALEHFFSNSDLFTHCRG